MELEYNVIFKQNRQILRPTECVVSTNVLYIIIFVYLGPGFFDHPPGPGRNVLSQLWHFGPGRAHHQLGPGKH